MKNRDVEIIGFDSGWGCKDYGCADGPENLALDKILHALQSQNINAKWRGTLGLKHLGDRAACENKEETLSIEITCLQRLAMHVQSVTEKGHIPIVIGGDHSSAIGTWSGVVAATQSHGEMGLIWLDAHMDSHTHETSSTGKWGGWWHGQPIAAILGHGLPDFCNISSTGHKLSPQHITVIGTHSFEPAEVAFAKKTNMRVCYLDEVKRRGFKVLFEEALTRALDGTKGFGLSIDLDAFHPEDAPGVGSLETDGLRAAEVLPILRGIAHNPKFRALEIAEYNPHKDKNRKTGALIEALITSVFTKD